MKARETMRDALHARIGPMVDRVAGELVELVLARLEVDLARLPAAFEIAISAYASPASDPLAEVLGPGVAIITNGGKPPTAHAFAVVATGQRREPKATPAPKPKPVDPPPAKATSMGAPRQRAVMRCGKCGALGFRSDGCGTSHAPSTPDAVTPVTKVNRSASQAIAAMRTAKPLATADLEDDEEDADDDQWTSSRIAREKATAESRKHPGALPVPRSSFNVAHGEVAELDFEPAQ